MFIAKSPRSASGWLLTLTDHIPPHLATVLQNSSIFPVGAPDFLVMRPEKGNIRPQAGDVRFSPIADIGSCIAHVGFLTQSGH